MKVLISQPMRDKTDEEILAERNRAIEEIKAKFPTENIEVIDSFFRGADHDNSPLHFLGKFIQLLGKADLVYFCKDWHLYRGCRVEYKVAMEYEKQIISK